MPPGLRGKASKLSLQTVRNFNVMLVAGSTVLIGPGLSYSPSSTPTFRKGFALNAKPLSLTSRAFYVGAGPVGRLGLCLATLQVALVNALR